MKSLPRFLPALLALFAILPAAAFEGKIHFDMISGRDTQQVIYAIKEEKARFEMPGAGPNGVASILDLPKRQMMILMPEQKMYMLMSLQGTDDAASKPKGRSEVTFEDTGETETILGRKCRKYRVTDKDSVTEVWGAEGIGHFMGQLGGRNSAKGGAVPRWQEELGAKGFFPLRVVSLNRRGKETMRMQATKIDETSLPDSLFTVPEGYQQFSMGGMLRGLIPGNR